MHKQEIGVIGLATMGKNIALNIASQGYSVGVYNRSREKTDQMVKENIDNKIKGTYTVKEFISSLEKPRKILLMVQAGFPTDSIIEQLLPHLEKDDILIDGGNSFFEDTKRRNEELKIRGIHFIGAGISGGEEGALTGPSIMPGGEREAHELVSPIFNAIAAKVDGEPCTTYIGPDGSGHYVKMVHNGIEYVDIQLIGEAYAIMKQVIGLDAQELHEVFAEWNTGELDSYLIEITADIFTKMDEETGKPLVDVIMDVAEQKGTGKLTSQSALDLGVPVPSITEAVFARFMSAMKEERIQASEVLSGPTETTVEGDKTEIIEEIRKALYMSKICSYAQGFAQMRAASDEYGWNLDYGSIAMTFRAGCIIRASFLEKINEAYNRNPYLPNLLLDLHFKKITQSYQKSLRRVVSIAVDNGIPVPGLSSAIAYYDSYRSKWLPANLLQAQRDYFGAHTYRRVDKEGTFHTKWVDKS